MSQDGVVCARGRISFLSGPSSSALQTPNPRLSDEAFHHRQCSPPPLHTHSLSLSISISPPPLSFPFPPSFLSTLLSFQRSGVWQCEFIILSVTQEQLRGGRWRNEADQSPGPKLLSDASGHSGTGGVRGRLPRHVFRRSRTAMRTQLLI